jgi:hypothetical protein
METNLVGRVDDSLELCFIGHLDNTLPNKVVQQFPQVVDVG